MKNFDSARCRSGTFLYWLRARAKHAHPPSQVYPPKYSIYVVFGESYMKLPRRLTNRAYRSIMSLLQIVPSHSAVSNLVDRWGQSPWAPKHEQLRSFPWWGRPPESPVRNFGLFRVSAPGQSDVSWRIKIGSSPPSRESYAAFYQSDRDFEFRAQTAKGSSWTTTPEFPPLLVFPVVDTHHTLSPLPSPLTALLFLLSAARQFSSSSLWFWYTQGVKVNNTPATSQLSFGASRQQQQRPALAQHTSYSG